MTLPCLPHHLAALFMDRFRAGKPPVLEIISLLSQMALGPDSVLARQAAASLYGQIILPLCDDFSDQGVETANQVLVAATQVFCRTPKGKEIHHLLMDLGLAEPEALLARHRRLRQPRPLAEADRHAVKKVFILSRVSLGADIAITSVIINRLKKALPQARIFLVGPPHLGLLFYNNDLQHLDFPFDREGSLAQKLAAWPRLYRLIATERGDLTPPQVLLFDPDTRLSQLGLLPLAADSSSHYLCSRLDRAPHLGLSEITNQWLDQIVPDGAAATPHFSINPAQLARCRTFAGHHPATTHRIVVNFGVGNDDNKRLADPFEEELLAALLAQADTLVILDSGRGDREEEMAKRLMAKMAKRGYNTAELAEGDLVDVAGSWPHGLLRFTGKIDAMAGLIICCDLYIGYDSCGQHVATATDTPAIICFAGAANPRFLGRWHPRPRQGKTTTIIIDPKPTDPHQRAELIETIVRAARAHRP
jgi:ADP-heptose:LPS heptosyltransferase